MWMQVKFHHTADIVFTNTWLVNSSQEYHSSLPNTSYLCVFHCGVSCPEYEIKHKATIDLQYALAKFWDSCLVLDSMVCAYSI